MHQPETISSVNTEVDDTDTIRSERTKLELQRIKRERRKLRLQAAEEYIGFGFQKVAGLGIVGAGVVEAINPAILGTIALDPITTIGVGTAFLAGKAALHFIKPLFDSVGKQK